MRRRLLVLVVLLALGSLVAAVPASAASPDVRAKKKTCVLKKKTKCKKANLSKQKIGKQNLAGATLAGANLSGATLTGTNLAGADLSGANFRGASLKGVNLAGANLAGATFASSRLDGVRFSVSTAGKRDVRGAFDSLRCAISLAPNDKGVTSADCKGASLQKTSFVSATIVGSDFRGANLSRASFRNADVDRSLFSGATVAIADFTNSKVSNSAFVAAAVDSANLSGASFLGNDMTDAFVAGTMPLNVLTNPASKNVLVRTLGLQGTTLLIVDAARNSKPRADVALQLTNKLWPMRLDDCALPCIFQGPTGEAFEASISTAGNSLLTASAGITCVGSSGCSGTLTGASMGITITPPALFAITVDSVLQRGAATPISKVRFESVNARGGRTVLKTCVHESTCSTTALLGTVVRVSVFRQYSNGYFGMNCPGESGDAFTNGKTLWPTGDDTLSGDPGDTTRYALHRICDAFTVTGNVTLTAVNDAPEGAPSG